MAKVEEKRHFPLNTSNKFRYFFTNYGEKHIHTHTQTSKDECDVFDTNRITQKQHKVYQFQHTRFHHSEEKLYKMTIHDTKCVIF